MTSLFKSARRHLFEDQKWGELQVSFKITHEAYQTKSGFEVGEEKFKTVANVPGTLTMIVASKPTLHTEVLLDDTSKTVVIQTRRVKFEQREGRAFLGRVETVAFVDTSKFTHFVVIGDVCV
jgi:hypothetical protein